MDASAGGGEFQVNSTNLSSGGFPSVSMSQSETIVVWANASTIKGRRFDSAGFPIAEEFSANPGAILPTSNPAVAMSASGAFVTAWESGSPSCCDYPNISGQRFNSDGVPAIDGPFQINAETFGSQRYPSLLMDHSGNFAAIWASQDTTIPYYSIKGQRFDSSGYLVDGEFLISSNFIDPLESLASAMNSFGDFVVVWKQSEVIFGRVFSSMGIPYGPEFQVNSPQSSGTIGSLDVAMDDHGRCVVVWADAFAILQVKAFDLSSNSLGTQILSNPAENLGELPVIATDGDSDYIVVWLNIDVSEAVLSINARRLSLSLIFTDGFESGDTSRW